MFNLNDPVFSPSWKPYVKNIASLVVSLIIVCFALWRFSTLANFNSLYLSVVVFGILFFGLMPIYHGRKSSRESMYRRHLESLPIDVLSQYLQQGESKAELEIIQDVLSDKQFN
ncbi:hypothetical protein [Vibrio splendidus]|uniref:hypothetical protein n=1 Tax=Vibrio splendidus TaxID=29497 RepID=UPI003D0CEF65